MLQYYKFFNSIYLKIESVNIQFYSSVGSTKPYKEVHPAKENKAHFMLTYCRLFFVYIVLTDNRPSICQK